MTLEQRLERLERQNRWMRRIGAVGIGLVALVTLCGQGREAELSDLEVRSLVVRDKAGHMRAKVSDAGLVFLDEKATRVALGITDRGAAGLALYDESGKGRLSVAVKDDGGPNVTLSDSSGTDRAVLGVTTTVHKTTGAETKTAESALTMFSADSTVIWQAPR